MIADNDKEQKMLNISSFVNERYSFNYLISASVGSRDVNGKVGSHYFIIIFNSI
jgi:hypothetical protein